MKKMKFWGFVLMAVLASVGFTACGGDDGGSSGGGDIPSEKQLIKVTEEGSSKTYVSEYTYDSQGRVVKVKVTKDGVFKKSYTYAYSSNMITDTRTDANGSTRKNQYTLENGRIVKKAQENESSTTEYTYSDGYLATMTKVYGGDESKTTTYKWSNGNMVSSENSNGIKTYVYTNYIAPAICFDLWDFDNNLMGFFGKRSRNLPSKLIDDGSEELTYDWTLSDGLPVKLILTEKSSKGDDVTIVTFEWK